MEINKNRRKRTKLGSLIEILHITDPTLPIGAFSHSNGLETYVQQKRVIDMDSAQHFVKSMLSNNYKYNDGLTVKFAYDLTLDGNLEELMKLDKECHALKAPREVREGSQKLGTRLIKIYGQLLGDPFLESIYELIVKKELQGHYAVIYGIITALLEIERDEAVCAFLYNATVSMVTNAVKLVPLGQSDGQQIIFNMQEVIETLTLEIVELEREMYGVCNPALDIKCMQHEHLYSRLYMS